MTVDGALELLRNAILIAAELSGPPILIALVVGIVMGMLQTVMQVNEASLSFVVKLLAVAVSLTVLGPRLVSRSVDYTRRTIGSIAEIAK
jgi:flagellar biosynthetic protein FliQ